ncbi:MAG: peptidylprolyl isomerase [Methanomassiliicoccaceae archaeon]|nr:peptidylprolyl isomerase [Methanomassiliicoccaceae archaeon]
MADNDAKKMIRLDYKAYLADSGRLYDTTNEAVAKEADIYNDKYTYEPMAYIIGSGKLFAALEDAISNAEVGKETEILIPAEDAAGARDPKLIEIYPIREFYKQDINPHPGLQVTLGNRTGHVMSVGAGRVKVDFNSSLAGFDLLYKFTVTEEIEDPVEKAKAILEVNFGTNEGFEFVFPGDKVTVSLPDITKFHPEWSSARFKVVSDLRDVFGVDTVEFVETWSLGKKDQDEEDQKEE